MDDLFIDDLASADRDGLLEIIKSGTDYPDWYKNGQSVEEAANGYIEYVKAVEEGRSQDQFKGIRTPEGQLIGCVVLFEFDRQAGTAEIGYFLHTDYQGRGIATQAAFCVVGNAIENDGLKTLYTRVHPGKVASQKILLNLGLRVTGFQKESEYVERDGTGPSPRIVMKATQAELKAALMWHGPHQKLTRVFLRSETKKAA